MGQQFILACSDSDCSVPVWITPPHSICFRILRPTLRISKPFTMPHSKIVIGNCIIVSWTQIIIHFDYDMANIFWLIQVGKQIAFIPVLPNGWSHKSVLVIYDKVYKIFKTDKSIQIFSYLTLPLWPQPWVPITALSFLKLPASMQRLDYGTGRAVYDLLK